MKIFANKKSVLTGLTVLFCITLFISSITFAYEATDFYYDILMNDSVYLDPLPGDGATIEVKVGEKARITAHPFHSIRHYANGQYVGWDSSSERPLPLEFRPTRAGQYWDVWLAWGEVRSDVYEDYNIHLKFLAIASQQNGSGSVSMANWTFGQTAPNPVPVSSTNGTSGVTYKYKGRGSTSYAETATKPTNAGTYTVTATFPETTNYFSVTATANFEIYKANSINPTLTPFNGPYDGSAHKITVRGGSGGTINYSTDNVTWSRTNPSRTKAGVTRVYVKVVGDSNHNSSTPINSTITITDTVPPIGSLIINGNVILNNGMKATGTPNVTLTITGNDIQSDASKLKMAVLNENQVGNSLTWENFATSKSWILSNSDGLKTVYLVLKDEFDNTTVIPTN